MSERATTRGHLAALFLGIGLATTVAVIQVARRHEVIRLGYQLAETTEQVERLREEQRRLTLEKSTLTDPSRIRALAAKLGMAQPSPDQIRVVYGPDHVAQRDATSGDSDGDGRRGAMP